jgi:hypothetical protein
MDKSNTQATWNNDKRACKITPTSEETNRE